MKLSSLGALVVEVPVALDASRRIGESKLRVLPTAAGYGRLMARQVGDETEGHGMSARGSVGIIGGGLLGLTTAYRLACEGVKVSVYEGSPELGGLAGSVDLDGTRIDRYYHVVLPTDDRVRGLAGELGLGDRFRFRHTRVGFYQSGRLTSMSSLPELLTFPGLRAVDRVRLGAFVARCQLKSGYEDLEQTPLEEWLRRNGGDRMWENLWRPLLDSKFDGRYDDLPATYLWARTRRMSSTRDRSSREVMGTLEGGYQVLVDALAAAIRERGGEIHTSTTVRFVASSRGRAFGVVLDTGLRAHDWVVTTQLRPNLVSMPGDLKAAHRPRPVPLPRRRLPRGARAPQHLALLRDQHHRPADPADHGGGDDARRRSRAGRRDAPLHPEVRQPRLARARPAERRHPARLLQPGAADLPGAQARRTCSPCRSRERGSPSPSTCWAASARRSCASPPGSPSPRPATSIPTSSTARP